MVVRISDVVLLVSWLSDGAIWITLEQRLVAPAYRPFESIDDSSPSNECNLDNSEHEPSIGDGLTDSHRNKGSSLAPP